MDPSLIRIAISLSYSLSKFTDSLKISFFKALDFLMDSSYYVNDYYYDGDDDDDDDHHHFHFFNHKSSTTTSDSSEDISNERLYLVHFRWWKEVRELLFGEISGVSYTLSHWEDFRDVDLASEIVLDLLRVEKSDDDQEMSFSDRKYVVIEEWMFLKALKWRNDIRNTGRSLPREDNSKNLFSLKIRLSLLQGTNSLVVKITRKDNDVGTFKKAYDILYVESGMLQILDFSEQTTQFFTNDRKLNSDKNQLNEIPMELHVYGLISHVKQMLERDSSIQVPPPFASSFSELGLSGLRNLGNTCFMNSAVQCLVHTPRLTDYFLGNFRKDLNFNNPVGMNGKLALAFGDLLRKLCAPGAIPVTPRMFKSTLSEFAPQFSGYNQHDSQEFLSFLLDGLHEDLNRVKFKPYIEAKDTDGYPDEEVADESWQNHLARNDSIVVDIFQGQYRSTLVCSLCKKLSITFDPFMYLSLPLPLTTTMRTMTLTLLSTDGTTLPIPVKIIVPENGKLKDVVQAVSTSCSLREDETLLLAEIYCNRIHRFLDYSDSESIEVINDCDQVVAYRLLKVSDKSPLVVFMHQQEELPFEELSIKQNFGIPLVARMPDMSTGTEIHKKFLRLLTPFLMPDEISGDLSDDCKNAVSQDTGTDDAINNTEGNSLLECDFKFYFEDKIRKVMAKILGNESLPSSTASCSINVVVTWPVQMLHVYDTSRLSSLPEICDMLRTRPQESVSIYNCLEAFLKEEPLGPDDMWYCGKCKNHQKANKKLDLWRLPEILVIHLKRFSSNQEKLKTFVDFPVDDFDLSSFIVQKGGQVSCHYKLYAVINHYGAMGSGHYTAFAHRGGDSWFEFNDSHVKAVDVDEEIKTNAAYVLFYRKISDV